MGDVNADPTAVETLSDLYSCATTTEGVKDDISLIGTGPEDAVEESLRLLSGIAETFLGLRTYWRNIRDDVLNIRTAKVVHILFEGRSATLFLGPNDTTDFIELI